MSPRLSLIGIAMSLALLSSPIAHAQELPPSQYYGSTEYVSGGIGSDEAQLFRMVRSTFPLSVNFSAQQGERIAYISDVQLVIRNSADQTVLNSLIDGPYCLIRLGPGSYKVFATYEGQTQERQTTLVEGKPQELNFIWK
ncbi:carboxypeptidase regulatory-like domain-containing protein [Alcaligenes faecalis]|uniref:Carboxypeptidase regulatory-like domain-containing protein n=1 Tax=Alcaligenes ammonioxydans TaxID=2582914 RepID=A0ABX8SVW7_9BURK|nr:carboxypeptidase-like regulatory domain-containing protein [Alcaligenes ammonioxydans]QXX79048.1 carboxypeptidase regulatory-like domain-containing protein [Alcaligenes ammonioxydans]